MNTQRFQASASTSFLHRASYIWKHTLCPAASSLGFKWLLIFPLNLVLVAVCGCGVSATSITPFSFDNGLTADQLILNGSAQLSPPGVQLTGNKCCESGNVWYDEEAPVTTFTTDFTFQLTNAVADGFTFTIQGEGPKAIGGGGGGLGSFGIKPSVTLKFDIHDNAGEGNDSIGVFLDGAVPTVPAVDLTPSGIVLSSGDVIKAHLNYISDILTVTLTDLENSKTMMYTFHVDIVKTIGSNSAYIGFTGGTGNGAAIQKILTWAYTGYQY